MKTKHPPQNEQILERFAKNSSMSRRQFMERAASFGIGAAAASTIWSGSAKAAQKSGGHMVVGVGAGETGDTLDIGTTGGAHNITIVETVRSKLVDPKTGGGLEPDLATEWNPSNNGLRWTFKLRKDVEFHSGKTLVAQDVVDSMNLHRGEGSESGGASMMKVVSDVRADGNDVIFDLSEPAADFPYYLAQNMFTIGPSKDGAVDQSGDGTGPFVLEEFNPGVRGAGKRNSNYFKDGKPYLDSFELISANDLTALSNGLISGNFHAIQPVDPKIASNLDAVPGISVISVSGGSTITMPMHADKAPFDNVDFRLAMKYSVNRAELRDKVFQGHASLANDHPVAPFDQFYNADIPQRDFDPDKTKHHLKKAGYSGEKVQIHASDAAFTGSVDAGILYAENARKAGIDLEVVREPIDGYWSNVWGKVPYCYCYWGARPTPDLILSLAYICGAAWGDTNWCHEKFTNLVAAARVELDTAKRKAIYADVQWILHEVGSTVVPIFQNLVHGVSDKIDTGGDVLGAHPLDTFRVFEKWSFKA